MINAFRKRLEEKEEGFTLIELLVVVIIIGILAAIAIPVFLNQRERAWERQVMSDMRNSSVVLEEIFSDQGSYVAVDGEELEGDGTAQTLEGFTLTVSDGVTLEFAATDDDYEITGSHANLGTDTWTLDSTVGTVQANQ